MYTFQTYAYFPSECINTKYILPFKTSHALILNFQIKTHPELFSFIGKSPRPYTENFVYTPFNKTILPHTIDGPIFKTELTSRLFGPLVPKRTSNVFWCVYTSNTHLYGKRTKHPFLVFLINSIWPLCIPNSS